MHNFVTQPSKLTFLMFCRTHILFESISFIFNFFYEGGLGGEVEGEGREGGGGYKSITVY